MILLSLEDRGGAHRPLPSLSSPVPAPPRPQASGTGKRGLRGGGNRETESGCWAQARGSSRVTRAWLRSRQGGLRRGEQETWAGARRAGP